MAKEIDYVYHNRISDMEINERPRERLVKVGPGSISNYELFAILLRTGTAGENVIDLSKRILNSYGGLRGLKKITFEELKNATSEAAAYHIWSLNNGNGIDKAPNGEPSKLFSDLL